jgi:hypothetical protein
MGLLAWGGQNPGTLPKSLRVASAFSILIYAAMGVVALDRSRYIDLMPDRISSVAAKVVFWYLCLGVAMNLASRSKAERRVMTPLAASLAVCAYGVTRS